MLREDGKNCLKYLKGGGTEKREEETKILKETKSWVKGGCLKKGGWKPLMNYGVSEIF